MLTLEIVSDIVCPWCFIGLRRLEKALAMVQREVPRFRCRKVWRPFFLNPDTPPSGEPYLPFLEQKFGGSAPVQALFERVRAAGRDHGIDYAFEKIQLRANTLMAHRLLHWAQSQGDASALVEALFVAQFQRGEHVGDLAVLVGVAAACGYEAQTVRDYLISDGDSALVCEQERRVRAMGITMVPTFIVGGERIVVGAEDPTILAQAILAVLAQHPDRGA